MAGFVIHAPIFTEIEMNETKINQGRSILAVDLKDLKAPWKDWCASHGLTPSEAVRQVLTAVMKGQGRGVITPRLKEARSARRGGQKRIEITLSEDEYAVLGEMAGREGMSLSRWLQSLLRVQLGKPQFNSAELEALVQSNRNMLALGRNINQIARHLNSREFSDDLTSAQIDYILKEIQAHKTHLRDLLDGNAQRWRP
ncbi:plasmid mobilization relaxosome protein MobC [Asticcacaulis tiandongensis]|uniref:plasmid mobilization relaxosome protein MobC n=1 Tax=Asticcacaulis tiandongensis TaxID=2565365 RepID=UPI00112BAD43|nr:plasmid mobilization relaxosome protein MobC [Asticcacaulis tiandongensis]